MKPVAEGPLSWVRNPLFIQIPFATFLATGLVLPLYAFPVLRVAQRSVDLATIFAGIFVLSTLPVTLRQRSGPALWAFLAAVVIVPLLAVLPPRLPALDEHSFLISYAHWVVVAAFFFSAMHLGLTARGRRGLVSALVLMGTAIALFALYQVVGIPRGWPGTGLRLLAAQRDHFRFMRLGQYVRPTSLFLEPSWLGGYLSWCLAIGFSALLSEDSGGARGAKWWITSTAIMAAAAFATVSLGTYADLLALSVVLAWVTVRSPRRFSPSSRRAAAVLGACLVILLVSPAATPFRNAVVERSRRIVAIREALGQEKPTLQESSWIRIRNAQLTVAQFRSRPLRGIGLGQFTRSVAKSNLDPDVATDPPCGWLAVAAEMGLFGPLILIAAVGLVLRRWKSEAASLDRCAVPAILAIVLVQQIHTASFIDLWWWYPVSLAGVLAGPTAAPETHSVEGSAVSSP